MKKISLILLVTLISTSCSNDDDSNISIQNDFPNKITFLLAGQNIVYNLSYNADNRLSQIDIPSRNQNEILKYENQFLSKINFIDTGGNYTLEYNSQNELSAFYYYHSDNSNYIDKTEIEYLDNKTIIKHYTNSGSGYEYNYDEILTFENGNIVEYDDSTNSISANFEYGNKSSVFSDLSNFEVFQIVLRTLHVNQRFHINLGILFNGKNEITKILDTTNNVITEYEYIYNDNNRLIEILQGNGSGFNSQIIKLNY